MAQANDEFVTIFNEVHPNLCRFLESLLGNDGAAQDIAQETFLRLHRLGLSHIAHGEARFWLFRVARNLALNEIAKKQTRVRFIEKIVERFHKPQPTPEEDARQAESRERFLTLLAELSEPQRAALLLREQEEMSYSEIALVLNISPAKVKSDIFRARSLLREKWNELKTPVSPNIREPIGSS